jgi:hypothetical protein
MAMQFDSQQTIGGRPVFRFADPATGRGILVTDPLQAQRMGAPIGRLSAANVTGPAPGAPATVQGLARPMAPGPDLRLASNTASPYGAGYAPGALTRSDKQVGQLQTITTPASAADDRARAAAQAKAIADERAKRAPIDTSGAGLATPEMLAQQPQAPAGPGGVTPEQLAARQRIGQEAAALRSRGTYVAPREAGFVNQSRSIEGADPDQVEKLRQEADALRDQEREALRSKLDNDIANNEASAAAAENRFWDEKVKASDAEDELNRRRDAYKRKTQELDKLEMEATSATVDQERFFKNKPGGRFLAAVMIGLGEFARGLREDSTNGALDIINASIDKDIHEQKDEIASKKDAVSLKMNAYARELADGADPRLAEEKLRFAQEKVAQTDLLRSSAMARNAEAKAAFDAASAKLGQQSLDRRIAIEGMEKARVEQEYQTARAGGFVAPTLKQVAEESGYEKTLVSNKTDLAGLPGQLNPTAQGEGAKAAAVAEAKGEVAGKGGLTTTAAGHAQDDLNKLNDLLGNYIRPIKEAGGDVNLETGEITGSFSPPIDFSAPGVNLDTGKTAAFKTSVAAASNTYANMTNNWAEAGQPSKELFKITGAPTENTTAKIQSQVADVVSRINRIKESLGLKKPMAAITETDATR